MKPLAMIVGIFLALFGEGRVAAATFTNQATLRALLTMPTTAIRAPSQMTSIRLPWSNVSAAARTRLNPNTLSVFVKDGADWTRQSAGVTVANQGITANVPRGATAILTTPLTNKLVLSKDAKPLNFWLPTSPTQCEEFEVESYADPEPARWNKATSTFETDVYLAIFRTNRNLRAALPAPVTVNLAGREAEVSPKELTFTNVANYEKVRVAFARNDVEARINVFPFTEEAPFVVPVRRFHGVDVRVSPQSILGFGLGIANLTIKRVDANTNELAEGPALNVDVEPQVARVSSSVVIPAGAGRSEVSIRSTGVQKDLVKVSVGSYAREVELNYRSPWLFIGSVVLGGLLGGCARCLQKRSRKDKQILRYLAEGCVAGVLAMAAVMAGVAFSLVPAAVAETELGAFLISAAVAMIGITAISGLKKLVPKMSR